MARRKGTRKRTYGTGSIYKDKKSGKWIAAYRDELDQLHRPSFPSEQAAETFLSDLYKKKDAGIKVSRGKQALATFLDMWFNEVKRPTLKPKSIRALRQRIEYDILPTLGAFALEDIHAEQVTIWRNQLMREMAATTAQHTFNVLRAALDLAVEWRYIQYNPARSVNPPRVPKAQFTPLSYPETARIMAAVSGHRLAALYYLAITLGLRLGELLGLKWADIDLRDRTIRIVQQTVEVDGVVSFGSPKSEDGYRTLPLTDRAVSQLQQQWQMLQEERIVVHGWREYGLVFPSDVGTQLRPSNFERHWRGSTSRGKTTKGMHLPGVKDRAGVPDVTFHKLRKTFASRLSDLGAPDALIGVFLGHARKDVTQQYIRSSIPAMRAYVEQMEALLFAGENERIDRLGA